MTAQDLIARGQQCEGAGDLAGAEGANREADQLNDPDGAMLLGIVLKRRGGMAGAQDAFRRAEVPGHPEAGSSLGNLLSDIGDAEGAKAAYKRHRCRKHNCAADPWAHAGPGGCGRRGSSLPARGAGER